ncbi:MAG: diguanylate cyclase [Leptospira sp.]|nr:diguanylate cyclase [Leptospira sp.]
MKILIIDDSIEKSKIIQRILKKNLPYTVDISHSAEEAFERLGFVGDESKSHIPYQILLMDIFMPGMNGIEATKKLKEDERFQDIPVLMITASNDEESIDSAFKAGAMDYITTTPVRELELLARINSAIRLYNEMEKRKNRERELLIKTSELNKSNRILEKISAHDPLTNLYNRRYMDQFLDQEWAKIEYGTHSLCVLMIDVDHFKSYNDEYGHQMGDEALKKVARVLKETAKRGRDIAARYGGEEFIVILPDTKLDGAMVVANLILKKIKDGKIEHKFSTHDNFLTCSVGVAGISFQESLGSSKEKLIGKADKALYEAKNSGRNKVVLYE